MTARHRPAAFPTGSDTLAPIWEVDAQVPAGLAARWCNIDQNLLLGRDFGRSLLNIGGAVLILACIVTAVTGVSEAGTIVVFIVVGAAMMLLARRSHHRDQTRTGGITAAEIDLLLAHRRKVTFDDWNALPPRELPREVTAARQAAALAAQLEAQPQWASEHFAMHRARLDPGEEARQIQLSCRNLYDRRRSMEAHVTAAGPAGSAGVVEAQQQGVERLDTAWAAVDHRLQRFALYTADATAVAEGLEAIHVGRQLSEALLDTDPDLAVRIAADELAADHLQRLRGELPALQAAVDEYGK